jgi:hypothetical protein
MNNETPVVNKPTVDGLLEEMNNLKINTVSKEEYERLLADNAKLIKDVATNRPVIETPKEVTREDIIKRCEARTQNLGSGTSLDSIKALTENYRDMVKLGMDVSSVDEDVVSQLEGLVEKSGGDSVHFKALMETHIKAK